MPSPLCPNSSWDAQNPLRSLAYSSKRQRGLCMTQSNYLHLLPNYTTECICTSKRDNSIVMYPFAHCCRSTFVVCMLQVQTGSPVPSFGVHKSKDLKKNTQKGSIRKRQSHWEEAMNGTIAKESFPSVERRLALNFNFSPKVTTIMTGHRNIGSYLTSIKDYRKSRAPIQTVVHLIFQCNRLKNEREF